MIFLGEVAHVTAASKSLGGLELNDLVNRR